MELPTHKTCSRCKESKKLEEFYKKEREFLGVRNMCKECCKEDHKKWREKNPGKDAEAIKKRRKENPAQERGYREKYRVNNAEKERLRAEKYRIENREKYRESGKKSQARIRSTVKGKLTDNFRRSMRRMILSKNGQSTFSLVGYTVDDLRSHLESLFTDGMTWDNYGLYGWHIDHKIPLVAFNYEKPTDTDFKKAWCLSNLQPLWAFDNLTKGDRLSVPFQPSFAL